MSDHDEYDDTEWHAANPVKLQPLKPLAERIQERDRVRAAQRLAVAQHSEEEAERRRLQAELDARVAELDKLYPRGTYAWARVNGIVCVLARNADGNWNMTGDDLAYDAFEVTPIEAVVLTPVVRAAMAQQMLTEEE